MPAKNASPKILSDETGLTGVDATWEVAEILKEGAELRSAGSVQQEQIPGRFTPRNDNLESLEV